MSGPWELFDLTPLPHQNKTKQNKIKACMESRLSTVQVESEQWTVHSSHQIKLKKKGSPSSPTRKKGRPLRSMKRLLISYMKILFLIMAAAIFGLD
jgi:hypothetical protein